MIVRARLCAGRRCERSAGEPTGWSSTRSIGRLAERGRTALLLEGFLKPEWSEAPTGTPGGSGKGRFPIRKKTRPVMQPHSGTIMGCTRPRIPTTGCRWACAAASGPAGVKTGLQIDCMLCHGGSIGGKSYVGLGNTQLDLKAVLFELTIADGKRPPFSTFVLNSSRGTNNAGQVAAALLSLRNPDLTVRSFPLPLAASLPEMDTPPWWHLKRKRDDVLRRPYRRSLGPNQHAVHARREELRGPQGARAGVSRRSGLPAQHRAAQVSVLDRRGAGRARARSSSKPTAPGATGRTGPNGQLPEQDRPAGDRSAPTLRRSTGLSDRLVAHYNSTWLGAEYPVETKRVGYQAPPLDGIWASAPYLHNGSVPTLRALLDSSSRPSRFTRPPLDRLCPLRYLGTSAGSSTK